MGDPTRLLCRPAVWQAKWADFSARHARQLARLHGSGPRHAGQRGCRSIRCVCCLFSPERRCARRPIPFPARETSDTPDAVSTRNSLLQAPVGKATGATLFDVELGLPGWARRGSTGARRGRLCPSHPTPDTRRRAFPQCNVHEKCLLRAPVGKPTGATLFAIAT